jgi:hypothetical protein
LREILADEQWMRSTQQAAEWRQQRLAIAAETSKNGH